MTSKKLSFYLLIFLINFVPKHHSFAQNSDGVLDIDEIMLKAKDNRLSFIECVSEMERQAPGLVFPEYIFSYMEALDDLYEIGKEHDMDSWGANPVISLGLVLSQQSLKWIKFDEISDATLEAFTRWASDETLQIAIKTHSGFFHEVTKIEEFINWNKRIALFLNNLDKRNIDPYVLESAQQLQGELIYLIMLNFPNLVPDEISKLMEHVVSSSAILKLGTYVENEVYKTSDLDEVKFMSSWVYSLAKTISKKNNRHALHVQSLPGDIALEILNKYLYSNDFRIDEDLLKVIPYIKSKQAGQFSNLFTDYRWGNITLEKARYFLDCADHIEKRLQKSGLKSHIIKLNKIQNKLALIIETKENDLEGSYTIEVGGNKGAVTLINTGGIKLIVGVRLTDAYNKKIHHDFTFHDISFDRHKKQFSAHRVLVEEPRNGIPIYRMNHMKFSISSSNRLSGKFYRGSEMVSVKGMKVESFDFDLHHRNHGNNSYQGNYSNERFTLNISDVGNQIAGTIISGKYHNKIHLNYGYLNEDDNVLYLTSGELGNGRMIHLRCRLLESGQIAVNYIIGGKGLYKKEMILHQD